MSTLLTSCSVGDEYEYGENNSQGESSQWAPLVISIRVLSPEGYSIMNAANSAHIKATFRGITYECDKTSRVYSPVFYGLKRNNDFLLFGELDGAQTFENEDIILSWGGDIKPDTITFTHIPLNYFLDLAGDPKPVEEHFYLNGEEKLSFNGWGIYGSDKTLEIYKALPITTDETDGIMNMPLTVEEKGGFYANSSIAMYLLKNLSNQGSYSTLFSPISFANALGILINGLSEDAKTEKDMFALSMGGNSHWADSLNNLNRLYKTVNDYLPLVDPKVQASAPTALFMHNGFTLYKGFVDLIADCYQSDYSLLDFNDTDATRQMMDNWGIQKTHNTIIHFTRDITTDDMAAILSTATFQADWAMPFNPENTEWCTFTCLNHETQRLPTMHGQFHTHYREDKSYEYIELPLANHAWEMAVLLPKERGNLQNIFDHISSIFDNPPEMKDVDVYLPRILIEDWRDNLLGVLQTVFKSNSPTFNPMNAHYGEMSPIEGFHPTHIDHHVNLIVDENGCTTFDPITGGGSYDSVKQSTPVTRTDQSQSDAITFRADRPFVYLIRERSSGAILLVGVFNGWRALMGWETF